MPLGFPHDKVHVEKDLKYKYRLKWVVYCDCCRMDEQPMTDFHHSRVVVRFATQEGALRVALKHIRRHQNGTLRMYSPY